MSGYLPLGCTQRECDEAQPGYWDEPSTEEAPRTIPCKHCSGTGRVEMENPYARLSCGTAWVIRQCPECEGNGSFEIETDEEGAGADMGART